MRPDEGRYFCLKIDEKLISFRVQSLCSTVVVVVPLFTPAFALNKRDSPIRYTTSIVCIVYFIYSQSKLIIGLIGLFSFFFSIHFKFENSSSVYKCLISVVLLFYSRNSKSICSFGKNGTTIG